MQGKALLDFLKPQQAEMLAALAAHVEHESPSTDKRALDSLAREIAGRFRALGAEVDLIANTAGGDHVRVRFDAAANRQVPPALVLCHFDTVWPVGALGRVPFRVEGGLAYGPGIFDMKASLVLVEYALDALRSLGLAPPRPVVALFTSDEEIGSPTSRELIEEQARGSAYVLVMEAPLPGG